jgi:hypothetical protein
MFGIDIRFRGLQTDAIVPANNIHRESKHQQISPAAKRVSVCQPQVGQRLYAVIAAAPRRL